jgi:hypothetical protein
MVDGAILDVSLDREDSFPVADVLYKLGIPIAFATGHSGDGIDARFKDALILSKPFRLRSGEKVCCKAGPLSTSVLK